MYIEQFMVFKVITQSESFTKAAKILNLTQPAISFQIKQLEKKYQVKLFTRSNRGVKLTDAGETFYNYCEKILAVYNELETAMADEAHRVPLQE